LQDALAVGAERLSLETGDLVEGERGGRARRAGAQAQQAFGGGEAAQEAGLEPGGIGFAGRRRGRRRGVAGDRDAVALVDGEIVRGRTGEGLGEAEDRGAGLAGLRRGAPACAGADGPPGAGRGLQRREGVGDQVDGAAQDGFGGDDVLAREAAQPGEAGRLAGETGEQGAHLGDQPTDEPAALFDQGAVGNIIIRERRGLRHASSIHPAREGVRKFPDISCNGLNLLGLGAGDVLRK